MTEPAEFARLAVSVEHLAAAIESMSGHIDEQRDQIQAGREDMREIRTVLAALQASMDRVDRTVFHGNGGESLKATGGRLNREVQATARRVRVLEERIEKNELSASQRNTQLATSVVAAAAAIVSAVIASQGK